MVWHLSGEHRYAVVDYKGSWNIGAFIVATNKFVLLGDGFRPQIIDEIRRALRAPIVVQRIYDEDLVGCFIAASTHGVLVPYEASDEELDSLKSILEVNVARVRFEGTYSNAIGNIILVANRKALIHDSIYVRNRSIIDTIEDVLDVEVIPFETELTNAIASYIIANSRGLVVSPLFRDEEIDRLRELLGIPSKNVVVSTVNMGNPIVRSGCVANDYGIVVGCRTSGVELAQMFGALIGGES